jgi:hypothetical protein
MLFRESTAFILKSHEKDEHILSSKCRYLMLKHVEHVLSTVSQRVHFQVPRDKSKCRGQENVDLYIHSPTRLHGVMLN